MMFEWENVVGPDKSRHFLQKIEFFCTCSISESRKIRVFSAILNVVEEMLKASLENSNDPIMAQTTLYFDGGGGVEEEEEEEEEEEGKEEEYN